MIWIWCCFNENELIQNFIYARKRVSTTNSRCGFHYWFLVLPGCVILLINTKPTGYSLQRVNPRREGKPITANPCRRHDFNKKRCPIMENWKTMERQ